MPNVALASRPVPVTITGCIEAGRLLSDQTDFGSHVQPGRYSIQPLTQEMQPADLQAWEGHRVSIRGSLLPGDSFIIQRESIKRLGRCDRSAGAAGQEK
jgi:hypothetical protein